MSGLGLTFLRRGNLAHPTAGSDYIKFADAEVLRVLMANGVSTDGVGITKDDAKNVVTIGTWFSGNTQIESFDEMIYFVGVKSLAASAFLGCSSLKSINCANILDVGSSAFQGCKSITGNFDLSNVRTLGKNALNGVNATTIDLRNVTNLPLGTNADSTYGNKSTVEKIILTSASSIPNYAFASYEKLRDVVLGESLVSIGQGAFEACSSISFDLYAPNLQSIGAYAFQSSSLPSISSLGKITEIQIRAFKDCKSLKSVILPNTLKIIGSMAFQYCNLENIVIGEDVTSIVNSAFEFNTNMQYAIVRAINPPTIANIYVWGNTANCPIYVPDASVDAYKAANLWSNSAIINRIKPLSEFNG